MSKSLIIAEKPSQMQAYRQALTGNNFVQHKGYLESDKYIITTCFGHLYEQKSLDEYFSDYDPSAKPRWTLDRLPFYPEGWKFQYVPKRKQGTTQPDQGILDQLSTIQTLMNRPDVTTIYSGTDPDREGEVIARMVIEAGLKTKKDVRRIWFSDQSAESLLDGIRNAAPIRSYDGLYQAGLTRSAMDWLIGIELTRYCSIKANSFVRVGRCVCVIVDHIVQRELEIQNFVPKPYLSISSKCETNGEEIELTCKDPFEIDQRDAAQAFADHLNQCDAIVTSLKTERKKDHAFRLFSLSDLQGYVCRMDKTFTPDEVLSCVQDLYDHRYVSYPRTNSSYLTTNETTTVDRVLKKLSNWDSTDLINKPNDKRIYDNSKVEAHSALIPTGEKPENMSGRAMTVYNAILNRFKANFCKEDCVVDKTTMEITCDNQVFTLKGTVVVQPGWRNIEKGSKERILPQLKQGDLVNHNFVPVEKETTPPKRYTVDDLNKWMISPYRKTELAENEDYSDEEWAAILKEATICTEATRADTIKRCEISKYISLKKGLYYAEPSGFALVQILKDLGINLGVDVTVNLSENLFKVKTGELTKKQVLDQTKDTIDSIFAYNGTTERRTMSASNTDKVLGKCPKCGGSIVESPKAFSCDQQCGVVFWKENKLLEAVGKTVTADMVKAICRDGKAPLKNCISKKSGKKFDCFVVPLLDEDPFKLGLSFEKDTIGKCPVCGGEVLETKMGYSCQNENCRSTLWKTYKYYGQELSISAAKAKSLFAGKTAVFKIKKKDGNEASANFSLVPSQGKDGKTYLNLHLDSYRKSSKKESA